MLTPILAMTLAAAGTVAQADEPSFSIADAAHCAVIYEATVQAMERAGNVPAEQRRGAEEGWALWHTEFNMWQSRMPRSEVEAAMINASGQIADVLPSGESAEDALARGDYLIKEMQGCQYRVRAKFAGTTHPAVAQYRREALAVTPNKPRAQNASAVDVAPAPVPVNNRGLR